VFHCRLVAIGRSHDAGRPFAREVVLQILLICLGIDKSNLCGLRQGMIHASQPGWPAGRLFFDVTGNSRPSLISFPHARISRGSPVEQVFPARTTITVSKELTEALTFLVFLAVMAIVVFRHLGALTISSGSNRGSTERVRSRGPHWPELVSKWFRESEPTTDPAGPTHICQRGKPKVRSLMLARSVWLTTADSRPSDNRIRRRPVAMTAAGP
jgi:hypothetical protein